MILVERSGRILHGFVGAVLARQRQFLRARGRRDDARAHRLAQFDRRKAHAARRAEHQQGFAGAQAGPILQRVLRSAIGHEQRRGFVERHGIGNLPAIAGGSDGLLGHGAAHRRQQDSIADAQVHDALAQRLDHAGQLGLRAKMAAAA